ncbi:hypothetical protein HYX15_01145 [Candidatus Woesearchaeota archaeon]|nr:hypothetical protein [Candidatus Woesearchaeota archaeon]
MKESTLLKISLCFSLIGVFIILIIAETLEVKQYGISSITDKEVDKKVKIVGTISSIVETPGLFILDIIDETGKMKVVIFKEDDLGFNKYDEIEVTGKVIKYRNYLEIEAETISLS